MFLIEELVWCEAEGATHGPGELDPFGYGPHYIGCGCGEDEDHERNPAWEITGRPGWESYDGTLSQLWFYTCPGPHYKLWQGAEV